MGRLARLENLIENLKDEAKSLRYEIDCGNLSVITITKVQTMEDMIERIEEILEG